MKSSSDIAKSIRTIFAALLAVTMLTIGSYATPAAAQTASPDVATEAQSTDLNTGFWGQIRKGATGNVSIPDKNAAVLIRSEGDTAYRAFRNGPLKLYSVYGLLGMVFLLSLYFVLRGRIKIDHGRSGVTMERFNGLERFAHWLMAGSFVILAVSGLNMLFGRYVLMPVIGKETFAAITLWGKYLHNYLSFAFMLGVALAFILWVVHNFPNRHDLVWLMKGGGLFTKGSHPPAKKFNAGQKILFWSVVILTISISLSGIALMFPFETVFMAKTFAALNAIGFDLPTSVTPIQEQQLNQIWHGIVGVLFIVIILGHIYIGSVGMEGAFDAMGSGEVDTNWAREHHSLWVEEVEQKAKSAPAAGSAGQPAE
ncbi:MAG: formate dehydrogenase subunit gamma [Anderseniella sp.]